jgi:hypothetical protein
MMIMHSSRRWAVLFLHLLIKSRSHKIVLCCVFVFFPTRSSLEHASCYSREGGSGEGRKEHMHTSEIVVHDRPTDWRTDYIGGGRVGRGFVCFMFAYIWFQRESCYCCCLNRRRTRWQRTNKQNRCDEKLFAPILFSKGKATAGDAACTLLFFRFLFASVVARIVLSRCLFYCVFSEGGVRCFLFLAWKKGLHTAWWYIASFPFFE